MIKEDVQLDDQVATPLNSESIVGHRYQADNYAGGQTSGVERHTHELVERLVSCHAVLQREEIREKS